MIMTLDSGATLDITPSGSTPKPVINYKLITKSDKKVRSIDRGAPTDRYLCEFEYARSFAVADEIWVELEALRVANKQVVLSDFEYNYFGDHVDHSGNINCVVGSLSKLEAKTISTKAFEVTFIATDITTIGTATLPALTCLDAGWLGYNEWNTIVNETYDRNNFFVDMEEDTYVFTGKYTLTAEQNKDLYKFWETQRGEEFTISDGDFGVLGMFGPNSSDDTHYVVIANIEYEAISPTRREVEISLVKNGGEFTPPVTTNFYEAGVLPTYPYLSTGWTEVFNSGGGTVTAIDAGDNLRVVANSSIIAYKKNGVSGEPETFECSTTYSPSAVVARAVGFLISDTGSLVYINFSNMASSGSFVCSLTFYDGATYTEIMLPLDYSQRNGPALSKLDFLASTYDITIGSQNFTGNFASSLFDASEGWTDYVSARYGAETYNNVRIEGSGFPYNE